VRRDVIVTVADSHLAAVGELAGLLREAGMEIDTLLPAIGIVTGSIDADKLADIAALPGVAAVEERRDVQLPPPGDDVQ
jgi:hypothetical protein